MASAASSAVAHSTNSIRFGGFGPNARQLDASRRVPFGASSFVPAKTRSPGSQTSCRY